MLIPPGYSSQRKFELSLLTGQDLLNVAELAFVFFSFHKSFHVYSQFMHATILRPCLPLFPYKTSITAIAD